MNKPDTAPTSLDAIAASMVVNPAQSDNSAADLLDSGAPDPASRRVSGDDGVPDRAQTRNEPITEEIDEEDHSDDADDLVEDSILDDLSDEDDTSDEDDAEDEDYDPLFDDLFSTKGERASDDQSMDDLDPSKLGDDLMIPVTVDEEEILVPLGELKKRHAGEGAIDRRLQEASELRNAAAADYDKGRQLTEAILQEFGQALFRRTVPQPTNELMEADINAYTRQKALFDQETEALNAGYQQLHMKMQQLDEIHQEQRKTRRQQAAKDLRRIMPVFNDPVRGPKVRQAIVEAAKEIGFTEQQISECEDPLLFKTVALAARELKRQRGVKVTAASEKVRTLPSKKSGKNRTPASASQRVEREAFSKARKSGSADDVAATMIVRKPRKRGRR